MFAYKALLAIRICVTFWLIKLWLMARPIKLIFILAGQSNFWLRKSEQQQINLVWPKYGNYMEMSEPYILM